MKFFLDPENLLLIASVAISGGLLLWPVISRRGKNTGIGTVEAVQLVNTRHAVVLDVRSTEEFAGGSITNARNIPLENLGERIGELARSKAKPVIVVCKSGTRAAKAVSQLSAGEFTEVYQLSGGIDAWQQAGLPLVKSGAGAPGPAAKSSTQRAKAKEK